MVIKGKAHRFSDDVNTDYIISGRYKFKTLDMNELGRHVMEDLDPGFHARLEKGDFLVAGKNFGCGSSREQAPLALKAAGVAAVLAESFARIYFRNSINNGLPALVCDTSQIADGDQLEIDLESGTISDVASGATVESSPLSGVMVDILSEGGLVEYIKKHGGLVTE
ncbi:MAG: 3-isopropylmalate dehydratase small subunit [Actinobacteria bacterium]|nr:3-isopropylmalate dehydratase small subunit [Actinomycetota bacterium]MCG2817661.1 3-isopropylmalate dehydratase small subunit [Actinomycetes bacterium]MBU4179777.1 3-isopropylmalate dehydratase small subunit [Actinomycetota bacterium]MBU4219326.1 3-isopropylmalate dehydratase small subunit [Actinomycetota bacterium]MBU4359610.1 3-isopropylmalate dehydratase small subunit [Actinomycetota bacterium]